MNLKLMGELMLGWTRAAFGSKGATPGERAARVVEEAIELAQVEGIDIGMIYTIADRVYSRPVGDPEDEIGGTLLCLLAYAAAIDMDAEESAFEVFGRIIAAPKVKWQLKLLDKIAAKTSLSSAEQVTSIMRAEENFRGQ